MKHFFFKWNMFKWKETGNRKDNALKKQGETILSVYLLGSKRKQGASKQDVLDVKSHNLILYNRPILGTFNKVTRKKLWKGGWYRNQKQVHLDLLYRSKTAMVDFFYLNPSSISRNSQDTLFFQSWKKQIQKNIWKHLSNVWPSKM